MSELENHSRLIVRDGIVVSQRITVERIVSEAELIRAIQSDHVSNGVAIPYHPEAAITRYKKDRGKLYVAVVVPPRIDRIAIDTRKVNIWADPDRKFIIGVPTRVFMLCFDGGMFAKGTCSFAMSGPIMQPDNGPELFRALLPNQGANGVICTGSVFREFTCTDLADAIQAVIKLINESSYNTDLMDNVTWFDSPFGGRMPADFEVPEALADIPLFYDQSLADSVTNPKERLLWFLCRWQAWTESHAMSWHRDVDQLVTGTGVPFAGVWSNFL